MSLARAHGIVTPYTAYLIVEDEARRNVPLTRRSLRELETTPETLDTVRGYYDSARADSPALEKAGDRAVANSQAANQLQQSRSEASAQQSLGLDKKPTINGTSASSVAPQDGTTVATTDGYRVASNFSQQVRNVRGKTFYQNGTRWSDAEAQPNATTKPTQTQEKIAFNSDAYFALLKRHPDAAAWLSLGNEVDVVIGTTLYEIR